ncbi:M50 family metallopeptidase [Gordonia sp. ABSL11-1]|uniref:M50 family metallopeptidase n=1 Tax=Gordonia sp. ABSL11-1 TaxID=3053924 RepID=UPI0025739D3C|nr:M50 family metallopeptidase [Gordonia sp. ABSL11-1]MDL9947759.1 M50 family metallopeptidase [Gordonia sp. ABSL11-1]
MGKKLMLRDITAAEREQFAIAIHESGHAITATLLGDEVGVVELTPDHPTTLGQCTLSHETFPGVNNARIAFAGPYSEAFWRHGGPPPSAALRRVLMAGGRQDEKVVRESGDERPADVPRLISNCWGSITGLARVLFINGSATQADIDKALFLPEHEPEARAFALASIRSGSAPGSFKVTPAALL